MRRKALFIIVIITAVGLFFLSQFFLTQKNSLSSLMSNLITSPIAWVSTLGDNNGIASSKDEMLEKELLEARLVAVMNSPYVFKSGGNEYLAAKIYSVYPFSNQNFLTINAGLVEGVRKSMPVTVGGYIFLGQIIEVFDNYSIVRTVFDKDWEFPVRIAGDIDALFISGARPYLSLIDKEYKIEPGSAVYTAGRDISYGLKIAEVGDLRPDSGKTFAEAELSFSYELQELKEVYLLSK